MPLLKWDRVTCFPICRPWKEFESSDQVWVFMQISHSKNKRQRTLSQNVGSAQNSLPHVSKDRKRTIIDARAWSVSREKKIEKGMELSHAFSSNIYLPSDRTAFVLQVSNALDTNEGLLYTWVAIACPGNQSIELLRIERNGPVLFSSIFCKAKPMECVILKGPTLLCRSDTRIILIDRSGLEQEPNCTNVINSDHLDLTGPICSWFCDTSALCVIQWSLKQRTEYGIGAIDHSGNVSILCRTENAVSKARLVSGCYSKQLALFLFRDCAIGAICLSSGKLIWETNSVPNASALSQSIIDDIILFTLADSKQVYNLGLSPKTNQLSALIVNRTDIRAPLESITEGFAGVVTACCAGQMTIMVCNSTTGTILATHILHAGEHKVQAHSNRSEKGPQLMYVQRTMRQRFFQGILHLLRTLGVVEDKRQLSRRTLDLLRNVLRNEEQTSKPLKYDVSLNLIASVPRSECNSVDEPPSVDGQFDFSGKATPHREPILYQGDVIHNYAIQQFVDVTRNVLVIAVKGLVRRPTWNHEEKRNSRICMRLDVSMHDSSQLVWTLDEALTSSDEEKMVLYGMTSWDSILASSTQPNPYLRARLSLVTSAGHQQDLGIIEALPSPLLLQSSHKHSRIVTTCATGNKPFCERATVVFCSEGSSQSTLYESSHRVQTAHTSVSTLTKIVASSPNWIDMANYFNSLRLLVADNAHLRVLCTSQRNMDISMAWLEALTLEAEKVRILAASSCSKGWHTEDCVDAMQFQIMRDEACGSVKETFLGL